ncbi:hypothetical protein C7212DRAFT_331944 [Tuber magnatum]|uniref:Uncharacterized protein n=1 Tax=Tuber magnatum TaxID=42249 RepID=A0A317SG68_9PEZI|nr:hypothetical protein C7212DRAFT_331944 [Tuber magnatum]
MGGWMDGLMDRSLDGWGATGITVPMLEYKQTVKGSQNAGLGGESWVIGPLAT